MYNLVYNCFHDFLYVNWGGGAGGGGGGGGATGVDQELYCLVFDWNPYWDNATDRFKDGRLHFRTSGTKG